MSYLRIQISLLACLCLTGPSFAAVNGDLDPRVLLMQTADKSGRCLQGGGAQGGDGCCGTSFHSMTGSMASKGAKNLCFGSQSISAVTSGAVSQALTQQATSPVYGAGGGGGGGGGSRRAELPADTSFGGGSSEPSAPSFFGGGGGTPNVGAPGPAAGAGLPFLLVAGVYALVRRHRAGKADRRGTA